MKSGVEPIQIILSENIKKYRKNYGYSQERLAEKTGLSAQTINDIEGGRRWVSAKTITRLAKAFNIAEYMLLIAHAEEPSEKKRRSSLKGLLVLQKNIMNSLKIQFERAKDTGDFS
jgi:transcriptional regulator with XRE-family HTH domain